MSGSDSLRRADEVTIDVTHEAAPTTAVAPAAEAPRFTQDARRAMSGQGMPGMPFEPMLPEPEAPSNSLAKLYSSFAKNEIEWKAYKQQYLLVAEKQAELMKERAGHIIAKAKIIHERELEQLREVLTLHNSEVISGLQRSAHEMTQGRLIEIAEQYVRFVQQMGSYPAEVREVLHADAARVWDHSRRKILKYALGPDEPSAGD